MCSSTVEVVFLLRSIRSKIKICIFGPSQKEIETKIIGKWKRASVDGKLDIIGLWEGVEMTGYETYGNAEARIEYKADGTYTYYQIKF